MPKFLDVGRSDSRTPFKHWVLNAELGRLLGIFANPKARRRVHATADPFLVIDLCAGDADGNHRECSPKNIVHHAEWARTRQVDVEAVLIEKNPRTFALMDDAVPDHYWIYKLHGDARGWTPPVMHSKQAVFVHSDPNNVADWPITPNLLESLPETATMLCTLGCNVGGLKRKSQEERSQWYAHVQGVLDHMPRYHDAILVILENDPSQWAYLLRLPDKWSEKTMAGILSSGSKYTSFSLSVASARHQTKQFMDMQHILFSTKKERAL